MVVLVNLLPVAHAMVAHGSLQLIANGFRAFLLRDQIKWRILGIYFLGSLSVTLLLSLISWAPDKAYILIAIGLLPVFLWPPFNRLSLDITKLSHAFFCGVSVTATNLTAGVAAGMLDLFYARTSLNRFEVVASKSATQVIAHSAKIIVFTQLLMQASTDIMGLDFLLWIILAGIPISVFGTWIGGQILKKLTEVQFRSLTRGLISLIGVFALSQGLWLLFQKL